MTQSDSTSAISIIIGVAKLLNPQYTMFVQQAPLDIGKHASFVRRYIKARTTRHTKHDLSTLILGIGFRASN